MATKTEPDSNKMDYGVVVFLDALGTRGIWKGGDVEKVMIRWESFVEEIEKYGKKSTKEEGIKFTFNAFSDTMILTFSKNSEIKENLLEVASRMIGSCITIGMTFGINLRGSISIGYFSHSDKMIIGPGIDEAAGYYSNDDWIGVSVTPSLYSFLERIAEGNDIAFIPHFVKYDVPRKNGKEIGGWAIGLNWNLDITSFKMENEMKGCKTIKDIAHHQLEKTTEPAGSRKWKNTLDFFYYLKSKKYYDLKDIKE